MESKQSQALLYIENQVTLLKLLSELAYPIASMTPKFDIPTGKKLNMYMGVGFWSHDNGLSCGLPVDIIRMILIAFISRHLIQLENPGQNCCLIVLLADAMAEKDGANKDELALKIQEYTEDLKKLLHLLNMENYTKILLASEVMKSESYLTTQIALQGEAVMKELENDKDHYHYIVSELALTQYFYENHNVGLKIGWIYEAEGKADQSGDGNIKGWDELKFDTWHARVYPKTVKYLYSKAGLKQKMIGNRADITEACPYLAFPENHRLLLRPDQEFKMKMYEKITKRWAEVYQVCLELYEKEMVDAIFFPPECVKENNIKASVQNLLKYWMNIQI